MQEIFVASSLAVAVAPCSLVCFWCVSICVGFALVKLVHGIKWCFFPMWLRSGLLQA